MIRPAPADDPGVDLFAPASAEYGAATAPRNSTATQHPAMVARPKTIEELAAAVRYAIRHSLTVVPQATGHGASGTLGNDVLLVDTSLLNDIVIDPPARTARVGAGAQWGAINGAAQDHGLLGRSGSAPDVAVCGFTFGGGAGWLTRPHGLASGVLTLVDFVDGRGQIRRATDTAPNADDRDALWAYRGGGGVGLAATLEFDLVAVSELWAGYLLWPIDALPAVAAAWAATLPKFGPALTTSLAVFHAPPAPPIPAELQGALVVHLAMASTAGPDQADALRAALASAPPPTVDTWSPADAATLGQIHLDPPVAVPALGYARWLDAGAPAHAGALLAQATVADSPIAMMELRNVANDASALPGAMTTVPGPFMLHVVGDAEHPAGAAVLGTAFRQVAAIAAAADIGRGIGSWAEGQRSVPDALTPADRHRVAAIRRAIDPDGVIAASRFLSDDEGAGELG